MELIIYLGLLFLIPAGLFELVEIVAILWPRR